MTAHRKTLIGRVQHEIEKGANAVEKMHKAIADLPLEMLERNGVLRGPAKRMRRAQDRAIGAVYEMVRKAARAVGEFASDRVAAVRRAAERANKGPHAHAA